VYRNQLYRPFRNAFFLANTTGLIIYFAVPLAPPRLVSDEGLVDTLRRYESLNMHSGIVRGLANQYAAMPSLHATDALIVGVMLCAATTRPPLWILILAWPAWVSFALLATGNHFWLDIAAGLVLGASALLAVRREPTGGEREWDREPEQEQQRHRDTERRDREPAPATASLEPQYNGEPADNHDSGRNGAGVDQVETEAVPCDGVAGDDSGPDGEASRNRELRDGLKEPVRPPRA
jgi:hypothetical protein